jgi:GNAT superfamily N-acetyltransferase
VSEVVRLTNADPRFYPLLGPFLSRREVVREVGAPVWDDDGKAWVVITGNDGKVAAFGAVVSQKGHVRFTSDYVLPAWRSKGLHRHLIRERLTATEGTPAIAVCTGEGLRAYLAEGFTPVRERGRFTEVRRAGKRESE